MKRRAFLGGTLGAMAASQTIFGSPTFHADDLPAATAKSLPRWRGFNLLDKFMVANQKPFREADFAWMAEWGLNFVRLPLDYRCWAEPGGEGPLREPVLKEIDQAVGFGEKHHIHVNINFHRAPGYTVARPSEEKDLWSDESIQAVCARHWAEFARRYQGVPNTRVSFNLFNEPAKVDPATYRKVVTRMVGAIRKHDANRLVICDGRDYGRTAPTELVGLDIAAATRGYVHAFKNEWVEAFTTVAEVCAVRPDAPFLLWATEWVARPEAVAAVSAEDLEKRLIPAILRMRMRLDGASVQQVAAAAVHWALYVLVIAMAATGYPRVVAGGFPIEILDLWRAWGTGFIGEDGYVRVIDPAHYISYLSEWFTDTEGAVPFLARKRSRRSVGCDPGLCSGDEALYLWW